MWHSVLKDGRSVVYSVSVNCLYRDRDRVSGRVTDRVRFRVRVRHPDSSGNLLIRRKLHYAPKRLQWRWTLEIWECPSPEFFSFLGLKMRVGFKLFIPVYGLADFDVCAVGNTHLNPS